MTGVVPTKVRIKVAVLITGGLAALTLLNRAPLPLPSLFCLDVIVVLAALYVIWCYWPKLRWGLHIQDLQGERSFVLTFDDGPSPELTGQVLDLLKSAGQKASFFVLVDKVERHPELVRRIVAEGHVLGLHGQDHRTPFFSSPSSIFEHLSRAKARLEEIVQTQIVLYRPSHGWKNLYLRSAVHRLGMSFCFWDYGVWDTDNPEATILTERLKAVTRVRKKNRPTVVLLHDGLDDLNGFPPHGQVLVESLKEILNG